MIKKGIYRHYKGNDYLVLHTARHSETEEYHVVYAPVKNLEDIWIRPLKMFTELVEKENLKIPRFVWIAASL
ncbi:MAG: DUF1653 domain-containing protein [Cytophagales bacterium]|nr:MAG: DUF1653 domain-containing protein [Cytophagales bacterium]